MFRTEKVRGSDLLPGDYVITADRSTLIIVRCLQPTYSVEWHADIVVVLRSGTPMVYFADYSSPTWSQVDHFEYDVIRSPKYAVAG